MKRFVFFAFASLVLLSGCGGKSATTAPSSNLYKATKEMMGTFVTITVVATDAEQPKAQQAVANAFDRMRRIEDLMSIHRDDTELAHVNREAFAAPVRVSDDTYEVIRASIQFAKDTEGAFDITVGPLVKLWEEAGKTGKLPADAEIKEALTRVGAVDKLKLDDKEKTVRFMVRDMSIDLGGIAKGYAVDKAIEVLRAEGMNNAVVQAGGQVTAIGRNADGKKWLVDVRNFFRANGHFERLELENMDVATSGDYERFVTIDGRRYSHIIDPRTGRPVEGASSVSIIAKDGATADAWSTAASVLGFNKATELLRKNDRYKDCQLLFAGCTQGFSDYLAPENN
jgi:thiamine biosynthesis lipoprotein